MQWRDITIADRSKDNSDTFLLRVEKPKAGRELEVFRLSAS